MSMYQFEKDLMDSSGLNAEIIRKHEVSEAPSQTKDVVSVALVNTTKKDVSFLGVSVDAGKTKSVLPMREYHNAMLPQFGKLAKAGQEAVSDLFRNGDIEVWYSVSGGFYRANRLGEVFTQPSMFVPFPKLSGVQV